MAAVDSRVVDWVLSSGRRTVAMGALASEGIVSAAQVARRSGRSVQNTSQALKELEGAGLAEAVGASKRSWRSYRLTASGRLVAARVGAAPGGAPGTRRKSTAVASEGATVRDFFQQLVRLPVMASPEEPLERVMARVMADPAGRNVYVVDGESHLVGRVSLQRLIDIGDSNLKARRAGRAPKATKARDLARPTAAVHPTDTIEMAAAAFRASGTDDLPVLNSDGVLLGELNGRDLLVHLSALSSVAGGAGAGETAAPRKRTSATGG
jgi:CBS domain-containing protein